MISFGASEDQELVRQTVAAFARDELRPRLRELEKGGVPDALRARFHGLGVALVDVPEELGGGGMGMETAVMVHRELAFGDAGAAVALWSPSLVPAALVELGSPEQAKRWLARLDAPLARGAVAWSERGKQPGFATTVSGDGALSGEKEFVLNGDGADVHVVFAQEGAFVVDGRDARVVPGARCQWLGLGAATATSVTYRDCPAERLSGSGNLHRFFARAALITAARQVGLADAAYQLALDYTQGRQAFGKSIAHFQAIAFTLADMHMDVEAAAALVLRAAVALDRGAPDAAVWAAKALVHANEAAWRVADNGVQLLGGAGYIQDFPVEKWLRDTKTLALVGGTDQVAQLLIADAALGLAGEHLPMPQLQPIVT